MNQEKKTAEESNEEHIAEFVPCEMFLEQTGFFSPSSIRIRNLFSKTKVMQQKQLDSTAVKTTLTIDALQRFGLPSTFDQDLYRAFLKICDLSLDADGKLQHPIEVPTKKLLRYAGKNPGKQERDQVREWFEVMRGTQLKGEIYNHRKKEYDSLITSVFSQIVMRGQLMPDGDISNRNFVWLSPWFKDNYESGFIRRFDLSFYNRLRKPIAKAMYGLLETGWYASKGKHYAKTYSGLCHEFLLKEHRYLAQIQQQLDPAMNELIDFGFLESWTIHKTKNEFVLTFNPGPKWFTDQKRRLKRTKQRTGRSIVDRGDHQGMAIIESDNEIKRSQIQSNCEAIGKKLRANRIIK